MNCPELFPGVLVFVAGALALGVWALSKDGRDD